MVCLDEAGGLKAEVETSAGDVAAGTTEVGVVVHECRGGVQEKNAGGVQEVTTPKSKATGDHGAEH